MPYDVGIIGAGYVGLPLATTFADAGCRVLVVDVVEDVVAAINRGESHIEDVPGERQLDFLSNFRPSRTFSPVSAP